MSPWTEDEVVSACADVGERWFDPDEGDGFWIREQPWLADGSGRPDAILVAFDDDGCSTTVALEAKSVGTVHQLVAELRLGSHAIESGLLGLVANAIVPGSGVLVAAGNLLLSGRHQGRPQAIHQSQRYPGDRQYLCVPEDIDDEVNGLVDQLARHCRAAQIGLLVVDGDGDAHEVVEPVAQEPPAGGEWLDHYSCANDLRSESGWADDDG